MKVVFHIDEPEKWKLGLTNAKNMAAYYESKGQGYTIEVLSNSGAVQQLVQAYARATGLEDDLQMLSDKGVVFAACNNALTSQKIAPETLFPFVVVVPAGVVELAEKQANGYAYIKP